MPPFERRLNTPVRAIQRANGHVEVHTGNGGDVRAKAAIVAVPLNALGAIAFDPVLPEDKQAAIALGQASRGIKIMLRVRGERLMQNAIRPGHPFGYLDSEELGEDGTQRMVGFGPDAARC